MTEVRKMSSSRESRALLSQKFRIFLICRVYGHFKLSKVFSTNSPTILQSFNRKSSFLTISAISILIIFFGSHKLCLGSVGLRSFSIVTFNQELWFTDSAKKPLQSQSGLTEFDDLFGHFYLLFKNSN